MKCSECVKEGKKSIVNVGGTTVTAMATQHYFDEDGKEHVHNPNTYSTTYFCSNGHTWGEGERKICWCGYNDD